jgi:RNA polymerase sigma factor (sigma-70 family)
MMTDVTRILNAIEQGDGGATEKLLPLVYEELRVLAAQKLSQELPGQTLQATALVHEAYIRLVILPDNKDRLSDDILALDEALEKLSNENKIEADIVKLRYFAGLTSSQAAKALGISLSTANEHWAYARARLRLEITKGDEIPEI